MLPERREHRVGRVRLLDLDGQPDAALQRVENLVKARQPGRRIRVMANHQLTVARTDVELDVIGAFLDRKLEGFERVFRRFPAGTAVREDERPLQPMSRCMSGRSICSTSSSA